MEKFNPIEFFKELRFSKSNHLGMGDVRLTQDQQDKISIKYYEALDLQHNASTQMAIEKLEEFKQKEDDRLTAYGQKPEGLDAYMQGIIESIQTLKTLLKQ